MSPVQEHNEPAVLLDKPQYNLACFTQTYLSLAKNLKHLVSQQLFEAYYLKKVVHLIFQT